MFLKSAMHVCSHCTTYARFSKRVKLSVSDVRHTCACSVTHNRVTPLQGRTNVVGEVRRWGGSLSSPPDLWVLLIPSRLKARVLLDMNASLIIEIIFPSLNSWEGQRRRFLIAAAVQNFTESSNCIWGRRRRRYYRRREFPPVSKL